MHFKELLKLLMGQTKPNQEFFVKFEGSFGQSAFITIRYML